MIDVEAALANVPGLQVSSLTPVSGEDEEGRAIATLDWGGHRIRLFLAPWRSPDPRSLSKRIDELVGSTPPNTVPVLVSDYLPPSVRRRIEEAGLGWLDDRGDIHVARPGILLHIEVPTSRGSLPRPHGRLFSPGNARVARALIEEPERVFRLHDLAQISALHESSVSRALKAFEEHELVRRSADGWTVVDPARFVDVWLDWWSARPPSVVDRFYFSRSRPRTLMERLVEIASAHDARIAFTGLAAAERIEPLIPATVVDAYISPFPKASILVSPVAIPVESRESGSLRLIFSSDGGAFIGSARSGGLPVVGRAQLLLDLSLQGGRADQVVEALRARWGL